MMMMMADVKREPGNRILVELQLNSTQSTRAGRNANGIDAPRQAGIAECQGVARAVLHAALILVAPCAESGCTMSIREG